MEPSTLIPIVAVVVGVPGFVGFVALIASHQRKMKTLAIREQELAVGGDAATLGPAVDALYTEFNDMRSRVAELQERLDFAERLLVAGSPPSGGKAGGPAPAAPPPPTT